MNVANSTVLKKSDIALSRRQSASRHYDFWVTLAFVFFFTSYYLRAASISFSNLLRLGEPFAILLSVILIYAPLVPILFDLNKNKGVFDFLLIVAAALLMFYLSLALHPEYADWFYDDKFGVVNYIFRPDRPIYFFLFVIIVRSNKELYKNLRIAAYASFAGGMVRVGKLLLLSQTSTRIMDSGYDLPMGYDFLICAVIFLSHYAREKKMIDLLASLISVLIVVRYGSRMPLVIFVAFVFFLLVKSAIFTKRYTLLIFTLCSAVVAFIVFLMMREQLIVFLHAKGIQSRTLTMLLEGRFTAGSGRDRIYAKTIEVIANNPLFGVGLYGDRFHLTDVIKYGYPHNMVLEVLASFGIIPGLVLLLCLSVVVIKRLFKARNEDWVDSMLIFSTISLQLIVSYSFWYVPIFWGMLAMLHPRRTREIEATTERDA